jgi:hypothetical protein
MLDADQVMRAALVGQVGMATLEVQVIGGKHPTRPGQWGLARWRTSHLVRLGLDVDLTGTTRARDPARLPGTGHSAAKISTRSERTRKPLISRDPCCLSM